MSRFFFNVHDGRAYPDLQGTELADFDAARLEAIRFAGALLSGQPEAFWRAEPWEMEVCDDYGLLLFKLRFSAEVMPHADARSDKAST